MVLTNLRIIAVLMMCAPVSIGAALVAVLAPEDTATSAPAAWVPLAQVGAGIVLHLVISTTAYRAPALEPSLPEPEARRRSLEAYRTSTMLRLALAESLAIISVALAFVLVRGGLWVYVVGAAISLVLLGYHGWPSERTVERVRAQLERDQGRSYLREELGLPPTSPHTAL